jgi:hypothetical protein
MSPYFEELPIGQFFNNQKEHMVINYDGLRLMLTIEFAEDKNKLSYINLLNEIKEDYING